MKTKSKLKEPTNQVTKSQNVKFKKIISPPLSKRSMIYWKLCSVGHSQRGTKRRTVQ